jgi:hypothetical protein
MGLKITREMPFGLGSRGFRFENYEDSAQDQKQYEEGRTIEEGRFREGSLVQKVYELLSNATPRKLNAARRTHSPRTVLAKQSAKSKARKSAA